MIFIIVGLAMIWQLRAEPCLLKNRDWRSRLQHKKMTMNDQTDSVITYKSQLLTN